MAGQEQEWFTRADTAAFARCSVATVDRARMRGDLQWTRDGRNGRLILIHRSWIDAWLKAAAVLLLLLMLGDSAL